MPSYPWTHAIFCILFVFGNSVHLYDTFSDSVQYFVVIEYVELDVYGRMLCIKCQGLFLGVLGMI